MLYGCRLSGAEVSGIIPPRKEFTNIVADLLTTENLIAFLTLSSLEIVLGIDNIVLIAVLVSRLPQGQQARARRLGLLAAMISRILLLFGITLVMKLTKPLFSVMEHEFTGKDLILLVGGLFLIGKATHEIHGKLEGEAHEERMNRATATFASVIAQIMVIDIIFSLDSVITAIGMARSIVVMVAAVVTAVGVMMVFAGRISDFIERHPTVKMLALSFLLMIGVLLMADGFGRHLEKGYVYFAMAFSLAVEMLNIRAKSKGGPVKLRLG